MCVCMRVRTITCAACVCKDRRTTPVLFLHHVSPKPGNKYLCPLSHFAGPVCGVLTSDLGKCPQICPVVRSAYLTLEYYHHKSGRKKTNRLTGFIEVTNAIKEENK